MSRVAAFDCGTNSLRLLIADVTSDGLHEISRQMEIVRLGQGVDATGVISAEAMARALAVTADYARECTAAGVEAVRFVATSASRDARNAEEFVAGVTRVLGVAPEVVSGAEEAELSFRGATAGIGRRGELCVVDLGGGSTEIVTGTLTAGGELVGELRAHSMDVGCVRLTERHLGSDPATPAEVAASLADVDAHLDAAERDVPLDSVGTLVGLAGSVTTITAHALRLPAYDSERIHGTVLGVPETLAACAELLAMTRVERAALGFMHEGRVDVIGAGALVWGRVVERVVARCGLDSVVTSEHDILDGIALRLGQP